MSAVRPKVLRLLATLILAAATASGCHTPDALKPPVDDIDPQLKSRKAEAIRDFEEHRDKAQYSAALDRWREGDTDGCREMLDALLKRNPQHQEARQLLRQLDELAGDERDAAQGAPDREEDAGPGRAEGGAASIDQITPEEADHSQHLLRDAAAAMRKSAPAPAGAAAVANARGPATPADDVHTAAWFGPQDPAAPETASLLDVTVAAPRSNDEALVDYTVNCESSTTPLPEDSSRAKPLPVSQDEPTPHDLEEFAALRVHGPVQRQNKQATAAPLKSAMEPAATSPVDTRFGVDRVPSDYDGGAKGEVARRDIRDAVRALAAGNPELAGARYRDATHAEPGNRDIAIAAAVMALRMEQTELALEMAQSAISRFPKSAAAYRTLGAVCYCRGDYRAAQTAFQQAISLDKSHPLSYFLMGYTLRRLGEDEAAGWNFRQARNLDPKYVQER